MQPQPIKDDPSVVASAITKARNTFLSGKTKNLEFRVAQLKALKGGIQKMNQELVDAVKADIGRESFVTWFSEISIIEKEIDHAISNIKKWS
jgi:aldehyde dehydrogenase (NAD+)